MAANILVFAHETVTPLHGGLTLTMGGVGAARTGWKPALELARAFLRLGRPVSLYSEGRQGPVHAPRRRLDETLAARKPVLAYKTPAPDGAEDSPSSAVGGG